MKIVETDNFGGDYPDESFVNLPIIPDAAKAQAVADAINEACSGEDAQRFWRAVRDDYVLRPGFEP